MWCIIGECKCIELEGTLSFDIVVVLWNLGFQMLFILIAFLISLKLTTITYSHMKLYLCCRYETERRACMCIENYSSHVGILQKN